MHRAARARPSRACLPPKFLPTKSSIAPRDDAGGASVFPVGTTVKPRRGRRRSSPGAFSGWGSQPLRPLQERVESAADAERDEDHRRIAPGLVELGHAMEV